MMLLAYLHKIRKSPRGSTAIEFAMVLPVMLLFTFGFFEFARALFTQGILNYSAEQATRFAMVNFDADNEDAFYISGVKTQITTVAKNSFIMIDESQATVTISVAVNALDLTKTVDVTIDYDYSFIMPILPATSFVMTGSSKSFLIQ